MIKNQFTNNFQIQILKLIRLRFNSLCNSLKIDNWKLKIALFAVLILFLSANNASAGSLSKPGNNLGLVGYWSFNDGTSTKATDFSGNVNTGTLTNMATLATATSGWGNGKMGKGLNFDGVNDYIGAGNASSVQLTTGTVSTWVKTSACSIGFCSIVAKQFAYGLFVDSDSLVTYDWTTHALRDTNINIFDGRWHYVTETFQSGVTNGTKIYLDSVLVLTTTMTVLNQSESLEFSRGGSGVGGEVQFWNGSIDDVRIYNRALSGTEVLSLYNSSGSGKLQTFAPNSIPGLNLWLKADAITGVADGAPVGTWVDSSGQGNNATQASGPSQPLLKTNILNGKPVIRFDGSNDFLALSSGLDISRGTLFVVMKKRLSGGNLSPLAATGVNWATVPLNALYDGNLYVANNPKYQWVSNQVTSWSLLSEVNFPDTTMALYINGANQTFAGTGSGAGSTGLAVNIGVWNTSYSDGDIAEIMYYKTVLSNDQRQKVEQYLNAKYHLYAGYGSDDGAKNSVTKINTSQNNTGTSLDTGLVGLWSFNGPDISGTTAYDRSGSGNNGTLTNGPIPVIGKVGQALNFDGGDDYVVTASPVFTATTNWTMSVWVKRTGSGTGQGILVTNGLSGTNGMTMYLSSTDNYELHVEHAGIADQDTNIALPLNTWSHLVCTRDTSTTQCYRDAIAQGVTSTGGYSTPTTYTRIGGIPGNFLNGSIDDVRIYNRALSAAEVKLLYNMGK